MEKKSIKSLKVMCYVALVFCLLYMVAIFIEGLSYFYENDSGKYIRWNHDEVSIFSCAIAIGYLVALLSSAILLSLVFINILKGIREGHLFPKRNVLPLYLLTIPGFIYSFCSGHNLETALGDNAHGYFCITETVVFYPLMILIFAQMYRIASIAAEENELTV